jgi:hypothetical protein
MKREWIKRRFQYAEYARYVDKVGELQMQNPAQYQEIIMVAVRRWQKGEEDEYYIGLPGQGVSGLVLWLYTSGRVRAAERD